MNLQPKRLPRVQRMALAARQRARLAALALAYRLDWLRDMRLYPLDCDDWED
jgi:hypothetical protein